MAQAMNRGAALALKGASAGCPGLIRALTPLPIAEPASAAAAAGGARTMAALPACLSDGPTIGELQSLGHSTCTPACTAQPHLIAPAAATRDPGGHPAVQRGGGLYVLHPAMGKLRGIREVSPLQGGSYDLHPAASPIDGNPKPAGMAAWLCRQPGSSNCGSMSSVSAGARHVSDGAASSPMATRAILQGGGRRLQGVGVWLGPCHMSSESGKGDESSSDGKDKGEKGDTSSAPSNDAVLSCDSEAEASAQKGDTAPGSTTLFLKSVPVPKAVKDAMDAEAAEPRQRLRKRERYGTYEDDIEDEIMERAWEVVDEEGQPAFDHLYDARRMVDEWIRHPTLWGMLAAPPEDEEPDPEGVYAEQKFNEETGPELRWETRLVLGPGGDAWHPANRKVKVSVYVRELVSELGLSALARERLLALVGRRYNPNKDELTIVSERYAQREENRKDVLRTLIELVKEAMRADELAAEAEAAHEPKAAQG